MTEWRLWIWIDYCVRNSRIPCCIEFWQIATRIQITTANGKRIRHTTTATQTIAIQWQ